MKWIDSQEGKGRKGWKDTRYLRCKASHLFLANIIISSDFPMVCKLEITTGSNWKPRRCSSCAQCVTCYLVAINASQSPIWIFFGGPLVNAFLMMESPKALTFVLWKYVVGFYPAIEDNLWVFMETIKHRIQNCFLCHLSSKGSLLPVFFVVHYRPKHPFLDLLDLFLAKELVEVGLGAQ